jgi:protein KRI1
MQVHDLLREYYKLDYEDEVGGVKTRFRYRQVAPIRDGLSAAEILALPDKDLNAIVGLRKLAPYREDVTQVRPGHACMRQKRRNALSICCLPAHACRGRHTAWSTLLLCTVSTACM